MYACCVRYSFSITFNVLALALFCCTFTKGTITVGTHWYFQGFGRAHGKTKVDSVTFICKCCISDLEVDTPVSDVRFLQTHDMKYGDMKYGDKFYYTNVTSGRPKHDNTLIT